MSQVKTPGEPPPGIADRLLRLFSDVRSGEGATTLLMLLNLFLLLVGYYVVKTVREPLVLVTGGAEMKSYAAAGQALVLMGFIPLYSWFTSRVDRLKLVVGMTLFFIGCIEIFYVGGRLAVPYLGFAFYIWVGIFSLASIAQFWSYANDIYARGMGERLFPIIAIGAPAGSYVGAALATALFEMQLSPFTILQITAGLLVIHLVLYWVIDHRQRRLPRPGVDENVSAPPAPLSAANGFSLILKSPYLRAVALLLLLLNVVNTTGEYIIGRSVLEAAKQSGVEDVTAYIGAFYGRYNQWVTLFTLLLQAFVVSRLVRYLGLAGVIFALPLVAFGAYGLIALGVPFAAVRWAKTAENSTDYSIMNTGRQLLWLPTSRDEKYKAKQAADTFFVRIGDLLSAGLVFAGTTWMAFGIRSFAVANLILIVIWAAVALRVVRINRQLCTDCE
jgi:ATP:ADP antiporter, AAA family